jgi:hypothetical protein
MAKPHAFDHFNTSSDPRSDRIWIMLVVLGLFVAVVGWLDWAY